MLYGMGGAGYLDHGLLGSRTPTPPPSTFECRGGAVGCMWVGAYLDHAVEHAVRDELGLVRTRLPQFNVSGFGFRVQCVVEGVGLRVWG